MTIKNQTDKELADAGRMLAQELSKVGGELQRRGYTVSIQGYYARSIDGGEYWEFQAKRITEDHI